MTKYIQYSKFKSLGNFDNQGEKTMEGTARAGDKHLSGYAESWQSPEDTVNDVDVIDGIPLRPYGGKDPFVDNGYLKNKPGIHMDA